MLFQTEEERRRLLTLDDDDVTSNENDNTTNENKKSSKNYSFIAVLQILLFPLFYIYRRIQMIIRSFSPKEKTDEYQNHNQNTKERQFLTEGFDKGSRSQKGPHSYMVYSKIAPIDDTNETNSKAKKLGLGKKINNFSSDKR